VIPSFAKSPSKKNRSSSEAKLEDLVKILHGVARTGADLNSMTTTSNAVRRAKGKPGTGLFRPGLFRLVNPVDFTVIFFGCSSGFLGTLMVITPLALVATTLSASAPAGSGISR